MKTMKNKIICYLNQKKTTKLQKKKQYELNKKKSFN